MLAEAPVLGEGYAPFGALGALFGTYHTVMGCNLRNVFRKEGLVIQHPRPLLRQAGVEPCDYITHINHVDVRDMKIPEDGLREERRHLVGELKMLEDAIADAATNAGGVLTLSVQRPSQALRNDNHGLRMPGYEAITALFRGYERDYPDQAYAQATLTMAVAAARLCDPIFRHRVQAAIAPLL